MQINELQVGDGLPERTHTPTNVTLFLYNAAVWNPHRIHYDEAYATTVEGHPGIVIDGPLQGDWLAQCVANWLEADGRLESLEYSNRRATYLGESLTSGGRIVEIDVPKRRVTLELWVKTETGDVASPGVATVVLNE